MPITKQLIQRLILPLTLAAITAALCAGPGAIALPVTIRLAAKVACPAGTTLGRNFLSGVDGTVTEEYSYVDMNCTNGEPVGARIFYVLFGSYFALFGIASVGISFAIDAALTRRFAKPLSSDGPG